jgi:hypothetical protein
MHLPNFKSAIIQVGLGARLMSSRLVGGRFISGCGLVILVLVDFGLVGSGLPDPRFGDAELLRAGLGTGLRKYPRNSGLDERLLLWLIDPLDRCSVGLEPLLIKLELSKRLLLWLLLLLLG